MTTEKMAKIRKIVNIIINMDEEEKQIFYEEMAKMQNIEREVDEVLKQIGVPTKLKGYKYLTEAILFVLKEPENTSVEKVIYPMISKKFGITSSPVERSIRHAIEVAWSRGDIEIQQQIFGNTICTNRGKPTNLEAICCIAKYVKLHLLF